MFRPGTHCFYLYRYRICPAIVQSDDGINDAGTHLYTLRITEPSNQTKTITCCVESDMFMDRNTARNQLMLVKNQEILSMQKTMPDLKSILLFAVNHNLNDDAQARMAFKLAVHQILNLDLSQN